VRRWLRRDQPLLPAKFETRAPSHQTAFDVFKGRWASGLSRVLPGVVAGEDDLFVADGRPARVLERFASREGGLAGQRVLELGPLEGAHTYQLERLGAAVTAVEANVEAWLKCLIVKEQLQLRARFLLGDFVAHLEQAPDGYDLIFASGVLYHLPDPARAIAAMAGRTDRVFIWTHVHDDRAWPRSKPIVVERDGQRLTYHVRAYRERGYSRFWGGAHAAAAMLTREDLLACLARHGFTELDVHEETPDHPHGPALSLSAWKPGAA
jgi:SAM-dependent methyltransferase